MEWVQCSILVLTNDELLCYVKLNFHVDLSFKNFNEQTMQVEIYEFFIFHSQCQ